jgi:DNA-directed RNA polymerase subunit beta
VALNLIRFNCVKALVTTMAGKKQLPQKYFSRYQKPLAPLPNLVETQLNSFKWLIEEGTKEIFDEFSPIEDHSGKKFELTLSKFEFSEPKWDEHYAKEKMLSYVLPLSIVAKLKNKTTGDIKEQEIFLADFPAMTDHGTFIVNGVERVVVPQLARSYGVFFDTTTYKGVNYFLAKIIPARGVWIEIESEADGAIFVKIDRKRKFPVTNLLRILGYDKDKDIINAFSKVKGGEEMVRATLDHDNATNVEQSYVEIYRRLRDGDIATAESAREHINLILSDERYDLSPVGRFHFNQRFGLPTGKKDLSKQTLSKEDLILILNYILEKNSDPKAQPDDIDHLGFRRVRFVGELLQQKMRVGMSRMKRNIQDRMSTVDAETTLPVQFINPRPFSASVKEFFTANQLSQMMDQYNVLAEIENLRMLSTLGPGGLTSERAGLDVRDVHSSHYGRACPIHTPEGKNIGLVLRMALYARPNEFGIIETPYAKVEKGTITKEIVYMNALEEEQYAIAHAAIPRDKNGKLEPTLIEVRRKGEPELIKRNDVDFIEVATNQPFSVATSLVPFIENDDANRALMGSNMQKQAVPLVAPSVPLVATGVEESAARDSGRLVIAKDAGEVTYVDARIIKVKSQGKEQDYKLVNFSRTNKFTMFHQRPIVSIGEKVKKGQVLADTSSSENGQLAIGQNLRIAFMSWAGNNYEDAIIISERLAKEAVLTSIHVDEYACIVRDTKLGPEVTTHDIPNVSEFKLRNLDEEGIIRVGAEVRPGDILVGKVTPKGETQLTAEERLLHSIFGEKAKDVKDTSKRMEGGKRGRVVGVKIFSREGGDTLESGVIKRVHVEVAQLRTISVGDKLAGRHGNKGVISRILPEEDMPYDENGEPVDIILTPLGVPSRMNLGQILELHLGLAAQELGYQAIVPSFAGATEKEIQEELKNAGFSESGKRDLYDGRTGEKFSQPNSVGVMYVLKLNHMVEDKIHMRSIGPYSLTTQQPLGGKAQNGGQRVGEMEVWAFLGYGAAYSLREVLTIKSDDIIGRSAAFDAIVNGNRILQSNTPATFNVVVRHLRGLGIDIQFRNLDKGVYTD